MVVIGAAGSVGHAVCQLARWRGCRVIDVVHDAPSAAQAMAFDAWTLSNHELPRHVRELTADRGAEIVYDVVGASDVSFNLRDFYHNETQRFGAESLKLGTGDTAHLLDRLAPLFDDATFRAPAVQRTYRWTRPSRPISGWQTAKVEDR
jgi:NADPH2:quinone reductase